MSADHLDKTYYCSQCRIETSLARVCPKCHRKTTPRSPDPSADGAGGVRKNATVTGDSATAPRPRWVWLAGGAVATVALVAGVWAGIAHWHSRPAPPKKDPVTSPSFGPTAAKNSTRTFGAPEPGRRMTPQGPPRICGAAYRVSIRTQFAATPSTAKTKTKAKTKAKAKTKTKPRPAPRPRPKGPEALEHQHSFLLAKRRGHLTYVPLAYEVRITFGGRTVTGLKLDRSGGLVPQRRTPRRLRRLGYHDSLQPGLRISDLIGRVQADLRPDPRGGLKVARQRLKNPLLSQWLRTGIDLTRFLRPQPPQKSARVFEDRRLPPGTLVPGLKNLVRRFRIQPAKKPGTPVSLVSYGIDAPARAMRRAKSITPVLGHVVLAPGEPLPRKAELRLSNLPRKGGGTQTVTLRLSHLGRRCNDK